MTICHDFVGMAMIGGASKAGSRRMRYSLISLLLSSNMQQGALLLWVLKKFMQPQVGAFANSNVFRHAFVNIKVQIFKASSNIKQVMKKWQRRSFGN